MLVTTYEGGRVNKTDFNVLKIWGQKLHTSPHTLAFELFKVPDVEIRKSGGVGSEYPLHIDAFSGNQMKMLNDGTPQEG